MAVDIESIPGSIAGSGSGSPALLLFSPRLLFCSPCFFSTVFTSPSLIPFHIIVAYPYFTIRLQNRPTSRRRDRPASRRDPRTHPQWFLQQTTKYRIPTQIRLPYRSHILLDRRKAGIRMYGYFFRCYWYVPSSFSFSFFRCLIDNRERI